MGIRDRGWPPDPPGSWGRPLASRTPVTMGEVLTGGRCKLSVDDFRDVDWNRVIFRTHCLCPLFNLRWRSRDDPFQRPSVFAGLSIRLTWALSGIPSRWYSLRGRRVRPRHVDKARLLKHFVDGLVVLEFDVNWSGINLTQNYLSILDTGGSNQYNRDSKPINRWGLRRSLALRYNRTASYPGLPL